MMEEWRNINEYYFINRSGEVKSIRRGNPIILKPKYSNSGYHYVDLGKYNRQYVHRLLAKAFIPNPENKRTVNHINGVKTDNRVENLEWNTHGENHKHAYDKGLHPKRIGANASKARLDELQVRTIRSCVPDIRQFELAKYFKMDSGSIQSIISGRNWKHLL